MKYDIAKNEDGPLRRTMKGVAGDKGRQKELLALHDDAEGEHQPATDQRVKNIEEHLAVRYGRYIVYCMNSTFLTRDIVPAPPRTLLSRLRLLEDHLIQLEKDYPPWAALHFNQPNRGVCYSFIRYVRRSLTRDPVASTSTPDTDYSSFSHDNNDERVQD